MGHKRWHRCRSGGGTSCRSHDPDLRRRPLEPEGATAPKNKFALGATRFRLAGSRADAVPILPRCLKEPPNPEAQTCQSPPEGRAMNIRPRAEELCNCNPEHPPT